jgi:hypothetical protein
MRILPMICFALIAAAGSMSLAPSTYALTYPNNAQDCGSTGLLSTDGVGNCDHHKADDPSGLHTRSASAQHALSTRRGGSGK